MSSSVNTYRASMKKAMSPRKELSPAKVKILEKLSAARDVALKQSKYAEQQEAYFQKRMSGMPTYQSETMYGSNVAEVLFATTQDRYHATKWLAAKRSIRRRLLRLTNLIERRGR